MKTEKQLLNDIETNLMGIILLLGLCGVMLLIHLSLAYYFHKG